MPFRRGVPGPLSSRARRAKVNEMMIGLPHLTFANIVGNLLFSGIGYFAFSYGKRMDNIKLMVQGGVLMGYSYVIQGTLWMYLIGTGLTAWAWLARNG